MQIQRFHLTSSFTTTESLSLLLKYDLTDWEVSNLTWWSSQSLLSTMSDLGIKGSPYKDHSEKGCREVRHHAGGRKRRAPGNRAFPSPPSSFIYHWSRFLSPVLQYTRQRSTLPLPFPQGDLTHSMQILANSDQTFLPGTTASSWP